MVQIFYGIRKERLLKDGNPKALKQIINLILKENGVKAEMAFLIKKYRETLENKYGKEKAENIYEEKFELSRKSGEEIKENFDRDLIRKLREMLGVKND